MSTKLWDVYISGPMRGYEDLNRAAFTRASDLLTSKGLSVWNPCVDGLPDHLPPKLYIMHDIESLLNCRSIYMLDNWNMSLGANAEFHVAHWAEIPIFYENDLNKLLPSKEFFEKCSQF